MDRARLYGKKTDLAHILKRHVDDTPGARFRRLRGTVAIGFDLEGGPHELQNVHLTGTVNGNFEPGGYIRPEVRLTGSIDSGFDLDAALRILHNLEGDLDFSFDQRGHIWPPVTVRGTVDANFEPEAQLTVVRHLVGVVDADFEPEANIDNSVNLGGTIDADFDLNGVASYARGLAGVVEADFDTEGDLDVTPLSLSNVRVLLVAGGAGGGTTDGGSAGGGGGGGVREISGLVLPAGNYAVTVGAGGNANGNGGNSAALGYTAQGGGRGATRTINAANGGAGGGGSNQRTSRGSGTAGQGYNGGNGSVAGNGAIGAGGGGGGAASTGSNAGNGTGGSGGTGKLSNITGSNTRYGGGGGGSGYNSRGAGGAGGGGRGQQGLSDNALPGTDGLGGGGGGGAASGANVWPGKPGGDGVIVIRYPGPPRATGGIITQVGGNTIHRFTSSGTFSIKSPVALKGAIDAGINLEGEIAESDPDAEAIIAAMETEPVESRKLLIDNTVRALKDAGVWSKLKFMNVLAAHDAQAARIDWVDPSRVGSEVNGPVFTDDVGYHSDGAGYVNTGYFIDNVSAYRGVTTKLASTEVPDASGAIADYFDNDPLNGLCDGATAISTGALAVRVGNNSAAGATPPSYDAVMTGQRTNDSNIDLYFNGALDSSNAIAREEDARPAQFPVYIAARSGVSGTASTFLTANNVQIVAWHDVLTAQEAEDFASTLQNYINGLAATAHDYDADEIIAAMTTPPTPEREALIRQTVTDLKAAGVWGKIKFMNMLAAHDAQAARVDWVQPSRVGVEVATPIFTPNVGYKAGGAGSYIATGYDLTGITALHGITFKTDSAAMPAGDEAFGDYSPDTGASSYVVIQSDGDLFVNVSGMAGKLLGSDFSALTTGQYDGSAVEYYQDGTLSGTGASLGDLATFPSVNDVTLLGVGANGGVVGSTMSSRNLQLVVWHDTLSAQEVADLHTVLQTYMDAADAERAEEAASSVIGAMTTPPSPERQSLIEKTVSDLVSSGIWDKLDCFYVMAAHDAQAARINWKSPGSFDLTEIGSPTFVADAYYQGQSGTANLLQSDFTPSVDAVKMALNDATIFEWVTDDHPLTNHSDIGANPTTGISGAMMIARRGTGSTFRGSLNSETLVDFGDPGDNGPGLRAIVRRNATEIEGFINDGAAMVETSASAALPTRLLMVCGANTGTAIGSDRAQAAAGWGAALSAQEATDLNAILGTYMGVVADDSFAFISGGDSEGSGYSAIEPQIGQALSGAIYPGMSVTVVTTFDADGMLALSLHVSGDHAAELAGMQLNISDYGVFPTSEAAAPPAYDAEIDATVCIWFAPGLLDVGKVYFAYLESV